MLIIATLKDSYLQLYSTQVKPIDSAYIVNAYTANSIDQPSSICCLMRNVKRQAVK